MVGAGAIMARRWRKAAPAPIYGATPAIPKAEPQTIPILKMPTARGWREGELPVVAPGLKVNAFARELDHPRQMLVLSNGDVLVAEALTPPFPVRSAFDYANLATMRRAGAIGKSANRITLLRDEDRDGVAEARYALLEGLTQPFGMALVDNTLYVANTDGVVSFPYETGQTRITASPRRLTTYKTGGHWTRNLIVSPDKKRLYVAVGSQTNIADQGFAAEEGRACIFELDLGTGHERMFASGLRNPVGMAFEPTTNALWTVVNERDGIGDETPPDYLTSVVDGAFYGWPYSYWGKVVDDRVPQNADMVARARVPDYALGGHTASLGLCWVPAGTLPGCPEGMAIGQHGSWNRSMLSGYQMVLVPFANGHPTGEPRVILSGFLAPDEKFAFGRPVGTALARDGAVLLADDVGNVIWRVSAA